MNRAGWKAILRSLWRTSVVGALALITVDASTAHAATVRIDTSKSPALKTWADSAQPIAAEWYPRLANLMASTEGRPLLDVSIRIHPDFKGVAAASGPYIDMSTDWVTRHPESSRGAVIHELVHVVQGYPPGQVGWLTEGIADYFRYAIYESLPLPEFPRPEKPQGYLDSYKVAAGFLFWLECGPAPGIVRQLNAALRLGEYQEALFTERTGRGLNNLWNDYLTALRPLPNLPQEPRVWRHTKGSFEFQPNGTWTEFENGKPVWKFIEMTRTPQYIEVLDRSRNVRLRLTSPMVQLISKTGWSTLYTGEWTAASSTKQATQ